MNKVFLSANEVTRDSFRLAHDVYLSGYRPDVILALWRGGTPIGCVVHEYFRFRGVHCNHTAAKVASYTGIGARSEAVIENMEAVRALLKGDRAPLASDRTLHPHDTPWAHLLIVDDIFDTGRTAEAVHTLLSPLAASIRFAMPYYKPANNQTRLAPDYFVHQTDSWLVFPHELDGLDQAEIRLKDPFIADLFNIPAQSS